MKKDNERLHSVLIKKFCFFSGMIVIIFVIVAAITSAANERIVKKNLVDEYYVDCNGISDYSKINIDNLKHNGGWFEVLNTDYECIYPKGKDIKYSSSEIIKIMSGTYMKEGIAYRGMVDKFVDAEGNPRTQITFFKSSQMSVTTSLNLPTELNSLKYLLGYVMGLAFFIILYGVTVFFVSKRIKTAIMNPINELRLAMSEVGHGNYKKRVSIISEFEFVEMGDSFNLMAAALEDAIKRQKDEEFLRRQLISDIGHDIRTPLTVIQGYLIAVLSKTDLSDEAVRDYLRNCYNSSEEIEQLLQQLIEYNKMLKIDYQLDLHCLDFTEYIREIIVSQYEYIIRSDRVLEVVISDVERIVNIDSVEMKRVIVNLLNNAVFHNPEKTKIHIEIKDSSKWFELVIADDGMKIEEDTARHIYEPFFRGEESRNSNYHNGLGLSIVKKIIDKHGFAIDLKQPYGELTKAFVIRINRTKDIN